MKYSNARDGLNGVDVYVPPAHVAQFSAYIDGTLGRPQGDMKLRLGVPFDQIPNLLPVLREIGGVLFEVTIRRVPFDQLPPSGWADE